MAFPTRPPKHSPPRRPLHERSDSQANERASPTLRMVGEPQSPTFKTSPYPTHPSHFLLPKNGPSRILAPQVFEDPEPATLQDSSTSDTDDDSKSPQKNSSARGTEAEDLENEYGTAVRPLSMGNPLPISVPPLNFDPPTHPVQANMFEGMNESIDDENRISDEIVQLPSLSSQPDMQEFSFPASSSKDTPAQQAMGPKSSDASLSSSESTGTILRHKVRPNRASYSAFPPISRPSSSKSNSSPLTPQRSFHAPSDNGSPVSPISPSSPIFPTPPAQQARSASATSQAHRAVSDTVNLQYPVVRKPSASGSWAESSNDAQDVTIRRPQRTMERNADRWNPHLSTVPSELTEERGSSSMWVSSSAGMSSPSTGSGDRSSHPPNAAFPLPPSAAGQTRDLTGSTVRMVNESDDNVSNLLSPIPGSRGSAFYSVLSGGSRNKRRSGAQARPTSRGSFFRDSIPAWAKYYYARSGSALVLPEGQQETNPAASSDSIGILRPRTRPNVNNKDQTDRESLAITPAHPPDLVLAEVQGEPRHKATQVWSPHLWHDRRSVGRRRSIFRAPSLDERAEGPFSRRNAQVLLFTIGFIFPIGRLSRPKDAGTALTKPPFSLVRCINPAFASFAIYRSQRASHSR